MTALLTADEAARLTLGVNVIVRPGDEMEDWHGEDGLTFVAPTQWADLEGVCDRCGGYPLTGVNKSNWHKGVSCCSECRDGRRIVPLYRRYDTIEDTAIGRVLVGRGSIEVVPVVDREQVLCSGATVWPPFITVHASLGIVRYWPDSHEIWGSTELAFDPLPVPGRDFGIVIDCVEVGP